MKAKFPKLDGRAWAYIGTVTGATISIAANLGAALTRPHWVPAGAHWEADKVAVITAPIWPALLFIAIEVLTKSVWPDTGSKAKQAFWLAYRFLGVLPVGLVAGVISYQHLSQLLADATITYVQHVPEDGPARLWAQAEPLFGPLAIDGLMVLSAGALLLERKRGRATVVKVTPQVKPAPASDNGKSNVTEPDTSTVVRPAHVRTRRTPDNTTKDLAIQLVRTQPERSRTDIAAELGVTDRTLRRWLADAAVAA